MHRNDCKRLRKELKRQKEDQVAKAKKEHSDNPLLPTMKDEEENDDDDGKEKTTTIQETEKEKKEEEEEEEVGERKE